MSHAARTHAPYAASSMARHLACPASYRASLGLAEGPESRAAAWGTACHEISERALRSGTDPMESIGTEIVTKDNAIEVDEEMVDTSRVYVDYVVGRRADYIEATNGHMADLWIEERFSLDKLALPIRSGGSADAVLWFPAWEEMEVVDLKGGKGVVEAANNPQPRTYGLGAVLKHPELRVRKVTLTIVQPRAPHRDGLIRSETIDVIDLLDFAVDIEEGQRRALAADPAYVAGDHCRYCPAAGFCPALSERSLSVAQAAFDDLDGNLSIDADPVRMTPEAIARVLDNADMLQNWLNAVRQRAHMLAEAGTEVPGYQLSQKLKNRAWKDEDAAREGLAALGLTDDQLFTRKLVSPAQADKVLGAKRRQGAEKLWVRELGGTNLVSTGKTVRPALPARNERAFDNLDA